MNGTWVRSRSGAPHRGNGAIKNAGSLPPRPNFVLAFITAGMVR